LFAGAAAAQSLLDRGAVDEIRLIRYPILLGGGTPLFAQAGVRRQLTLTGTEAFDSGATLQRYRFA
jgi:riboflavin biosynthesis pyrimidine reductase